MTLDLLAHWSTDPLIQWAVGSPKRISRRKRATLLRLFSDLGCRRCWLPRTPRVPGISSSYRSLSWASVSGAAAADADPLEVAEARSVVAGGRSGARVAAALVGRISMHVQRGEGLLESERIRARSLRSEKRCGSGARSDQRGADGQDDGHHDGGDGHDHNDPGRHRDD
jgi:hypothetical protein